VVGEQGRRQAEEGSLREPVAGFGLDDAAGADKLGGSAGADEVSDHPAVVE
jgi:hypothetical protein